MKTITKTYKVYKFNELSEESKQEVFKNLYDINIDYEWWDFVYEDAEQIGLKITGFDIDRGSYCSGNLIKPIEECIKLMLDNHGELTDTYKLAKQYQDEIKNLNQESEDYDNELEAISDSLLLDLCEEYKVMLSKEFDYKTSEEAIIETIEANDYNFLEDGTLFN